MAEADKVILKAFYGAQPAHSYFSGCSQGGHEAMIEAQRYPADFDGIIAGDPANNWTHHYIGGHLWMALAMDGDGYIPANKVHILADAVNEQVRRAGWDQGWRVERSTPLQFQPRDTALQGLGYLSSASRASRWRRCRRSGPVCGRPRVR